MVREGERGIRRWRGMRRERKRSSSVMGPYEEGGGGTGLVLVG